MTLIKISVMPAVHGDIDCSRGKTLPDGTCIWPSCVKTDLICPDELEYNQAKMDCEQRGGTLAIIDTVEKKNAIPQIPSHQ